MPAAVAMLTLQVPLPQRWKESPLLKQFHAPVSQAPLRAPAEEPFSGAAAGDGDAAGGGAGFEEVATGAGADVGATDDDDAGGD